MIKVKPMSRATQIELSAVVTDLVNFQEALALMSRCLDTMLDVAMMMPAGELTDEFIDRILELKVVEPNTDFAAFNRSMRKFIAILKAHLSAEDSDA